MDQYIGRHGIITDPDTTKNDPDALIEVSVEGKGTHRFPQDCLRPARRMIDGYGKQDRHSHGQRSA